MAPRSRSGLSKLRNKEGGTRIEDTQPVFYQIENVIRSVIPKDQIDLVIEGLPAPIDVQVVGHDPKNYQEVGSCKSASSPPGSRRCLFEPSAGFLTNEINPIGGGLYPEGENQRLASCAESLEWGPARRCGLLTCGLTANESIFRPRMLL
jgi:hypothetical protein